MTLRFTCTNSQSPITAPDAAAGQQAPCPKCGTPMTAPPAAIASNTNSEPDTRKPCPLCGGEIFVNAIFCKHCQRPLTTPPPAVDPPVLNPIIAPAVASNHAVPWLKIGDEYSVTVNDTVYKVKEITQFDTDNDTLTVNVGHDEQPIIWTMKQLWDSDHKHLSLHMTLQDGTNDDLLFVRNL